MRWRVVLIGSGNVATSLALALNGKCHLVQVYSRSMASAEALASRVGAQATNDLSQIVTDADIYVISVVDDAITRVLETCPARGGLWVHTSGSTSIDVFKGKRTRYGVLYPMQSFSKSCPADMHKVHIFIEGCDSCATQEVKELAMLLTNNVHEITSTERERLHVAAVFACNFANHMFTLSSEVLDEAGIPFDAMLPLIKTTIAKLDNLTPTQSQTGPAARGDVNVIERHLQSLSGDKHDIYRLLSQSILNRRTR
ncbi:MAG: Rossmann-like and DUF2520 domain-containing protein [Bacteroidales bacterium]|nr:Rossmann-like and DUF2520 domain-containing protein [Bacteroidales bacterium]